MTIYEYMEQAKATPFKWGKFDCCIYAAGAIEIATGDNPMMGCPQYNNEVTASIVLRETFGSASVREIFLKLVDRYNAVKVDVHEMKDGDLACIEWPHRFIKESELDESVGMGVVYNNQILVCSSHGLIPVPDRFYILDIWRF